jgi:iron complex transport system substrate-binding protein
LCFLTARLTRCRSDAGGVTDSCSASAPARIASVGRTDHDVLLALGITPATVYRFVPSMTRGVGIWALPRLGAANPVIVTAPLNFEQIAAVAPDLVLNVQSSGDANEYHTLSQLAPTIGLPPDTAPNTVSWGAPSRRQRRP